jgi:mRNA interferase MazF
VVVLAAGTLVLVRFPFSDLSGAKLRPAVVLASVGRGDYILCQVTSRPYGDDRAIEIDRAGFAAGGLRLTSYARPTKLFTANAALVTSEVAKLKPEFFRAIVRSVIEILEAASPG